MPRLPARLACGAVALMLTVAATGQDYILRPGPRGFDPRMNRYGVTEEKPATPTAAPRFDSSQTNIRIELLTAGDGGTAVEAQQWSRTLANLGYSARIRRPLLDDKPEVTERTQGPLRLVTIVGTIDRRGTLRLGDRTFAPHQAAELKDWLASIKKYGAQGSPEGQPFWGLSRAQFESVYRSLSEPVAVDVTGLPLSAAITKLPLPAEHPLQFSASARRLLEAQSATNGVSRSVAGLTTGTALAYLLNEYGLGFHPERTADGSIVLAVGTLSEASSSNNDDETPASPPFWPVGWSVDAPPGANAAADSPSRVDVAPTLFRLTNIGFPDIPLTDALATVEAETDVPVLIDRPGIAAAQIDLAKSRAKLPTRKTSWSLALRYATTPNRLDADLRRDEAGQPLVWVTSLR